MGRESPQDESDQTVALRVAKTYHKSFPGAGAIAFVRDSWESTTSIYRVRASDRHIFSREQNRTVPATRCSPIRHPLPLSMSKLG